MGGKQDEDEAYGEAEGRSWGPVEGGKQAGYGG